MASTMRLVSADQLGELPPTELLGETHLIARGFNVIFGPSGSFKSFYTLDACLQIAQDHPVIYVAAEGVSGLHRRVAAWCTHNELSPGQLFFICQEINLLKWESVDELLTLAAPISPELVVFDTLARCIPGGEENSAKDPGIAIFHSSIIQRELSSAVAWVHHSNRAERGERGSGAIRGAADSMIEMASSGDGIIQVSCSKIKDDEPWPAEDYKFHAVGDSGVLLPANEVSTQQLTADQLRVLEFMDLEIFIDTPGVSARMIVTALNISERSVYRILSRLKQLCHITHGRAGDPYYLTDSGKLMLCQRHANPANVVNIRKQVI